MSHVNGYRLLTQLLTLLPAALLASLLMAASAFAQETARASETAEAADAAEAVLGDTQTEQDSAASAEAVGPTPSLDPVEAGDVDLEFADGIPGAIVEPETPPIDPEAERLTALVETGMALWNVPGAAVALAGSGNVRYQRGFGQTTFEDGEPVDEHTLFAIASTTKAMVVAGILMLADEGKLALDDLAVKYIPELHFKNPLLTRQVTVRDLLTHRTGLPSTDFWTFFQEMPLAEQIDRLDQVDATAGLRAKLIYQNTMYELAGLVIERVSGKHWDDLLTEWLWRPIGMHDTYGARGKIRQGRSHVLPHFFLADQLSVAPWDIPAGLADAAGSVWSSVHDMTLWAQFLLRGGVTADGRRLISEERFGEMFAPQQLIDEENFYPTAELTRPSWRSYGLGWFQQDFQGRKIDYHTGSLSGLVAIIGLDRANDRAVIVLANRDHAEFRHAVLWDVLDTAGGDARPDWNQAVFDLYARRAEARETKWAETRQKRLTNANPGLPFDAYIGSYRSPVNGDIVIGRHERRLQLRTARITLEMRHWHLDTFLIEYQPWNLREFATFRIDTDGSVSGLDVLGDTFKRLDPKPPPQR